MDHAAFRLLSPVGTGGSIPPRTIEGACVAAEAACLSTLDGRQAIDAALGRLVETVGPDLLTSVYVREHERLWLIAQRGYDQVRDGFALGQGVMARAMRTGEVQYLPDVSSDPDFIPATDGLRSEIAVPLGDGLPAPAVFNVETRTRALGPEVVEVFADMGRCLGQRVQGLAGHLELDLSSLSRLFVYASSLRGVGPVAELAARSLGRLLALETAQVSLVRDDGRFVLASFWRTDRCEAEPLSAVFLDRVVTLAEAATATYSVVDLGLTGVASENGGAPAWLVWLPLEAGGKRIGALVGSAARQIAFSREHGEVATLLTAHAASLIDAAQALEREQRAAVSDALTGVLNRRGFDERFHKELARATRIDGRLAVVLIDCDGLKQINDRGGHELGDRALQAVAAFLLDASGPSDEVARLGGDEFALLLPGEDEEAAQAAVERLRQGLVGVAFPGGPLTASFGVAVYPFAGTTLAELLRSADGAMYAAKGRSKDCVAR